MNVGLKSVLRKMTALLVALLVVLGVVGCGSPEPQPLIFNAAPWQSGESSEYRLTDINGAYAGTARYDWIALGTDGWSLRREINAQGVQEIVAVDVRAPDYRPIQATVVRMDANGTEQVRAAYAGADVNLELTTKQNITTFERMRIPSDARDQATLAMLVRALPLAERYATRLNVFLPVVGQLDRVTVSVLQREQVTTPAGTFETWAVHLETPTSETDVWIGAQAPFPLVKFIDSRNGGTFELSSFTPGP